MSEIARVLAYTRTGEALSYGEHFERYGPLPDLQGEAIVAEVERSGLRGRGGAAFPTATKLQAVRAARRRPIVVANAAEGEPSSAKDKLLLSATPHLVVDGAVLAARAVGARSAAICVADDAALRSVQDALAERPGDPMDVNVFRVANTYVSGEESALVHQLNGGPAKPTFVPPRPFQRGVRGRPTLVQNVETLAHLAQIARFGADWFRECGTDHDPGTTLVTVSGAVNAPGVYEVDCGTSLRDAVALAGGQSARLQAFLVGGCFGTWIRGAVDVPLCHSGLQAFGGSLGAGIVVALADGVCGVDQSAQIVRYLADESAGQCGPCVYGLDAIARASEDLATGRANEAALAWIDRWCTQIPGRGACHHPDGAVRFLRSALDVFRHDFEAHVDGRCDAARAMA